MKQNHNLGCEDRFVPSCQPCAPHAVAGDCFLPVLQAWSSSVAWCQEENLYLNCCCQRAQCVCSMLLDVPVVLRANAGVIMPVHSYHLWQNGSWL